MKEIRAIVARYQEEKQQQTPAALATVVAVEGSSYRRVGARMLVLETGEYVGGISGGCLERDARKKARFAIHRQQPSYAIYDTTQGDDHQIGVGLGCNGIIHVLLQPIDYTDPNNAVACLERLLAQPRQVQQVATITKSDSPEYPMGTSWLIGDTRFSRLNEQLLPYLGERRSRLYELPEENLTVCLETVFPEIQIFLAGYQTDTLPLARLAREIGFTPLLIAPTWQVPPAIHSLVSKIFAPDGELEELGIDAFSAVILMSHDLGKDTYQLARFLPSAIPFIGMLGPKVRAEKIQKSLEEQGYVFTDEQKKRIHAPVGLDIGATTPEEIALSILAEIRAFFSGRSAKPLRDRDRPIYAD